MAYLSDCSQVRFNEINALELLVLPVILVQSILLLASYSFLPGLEAKPYFAPAILILTTLSLFHLESFLISSWFRISIDDLLHTSIV